LKLVTDLVNERNLVFEQKQRHEINKTLLHPEHSKSLLSVPSICVDNLDTASTISTPFDTPTNCDTSSMCDERSLVDVETVSMIVRNVEAMDKSSFDVKWPSASCSQEAAIKDHQENKKHHDFIHDLKGSIQEKFHNFVHHDASHKKDLPHDHSRSKEILHDFKENFSGKMHQIAEKIHHIHMPHVTHHHEDTLVSQAMQTILLEQFNIADASTSPQIPPTPDSSVIQKRKSSSSSLQSIKQKFNLFQRPRRSVELPSETNSLNSISEVNSGSLPDKDHIKQLIEDHPDENQSVGSFESTITVLPLSEQKAISKDDLKLSVQNFDSFLSNKKSCDNSSCKNAITADTNKPLHESLLSLSRNELLSASPNVKTHARTESIGCKFSASPSKQQQTCASGGSLPASTAIYRRSSDSDLSITPKGMGIL